MKMKQLVYLSTLAATLLITSCSNDMPYDYEGESSYNKELMDVTFTISADDFGMITRADETNYPNAGHGDKQIYGRGSKIDMLVYAVYMVGDDGTQTLLTQYAQGYVDVNEKPTDYFNNKPAYLADSDRPGQTIVNVKDVFNKVDSEGNPTGNYGSYTLSLRLMRNQKYTIAFWAQSSETKAYDTSDLKKVAVDYIYIDQDGKEIAGQTYDANFGNNSDEYRDAFCKSETFNVSANSLTRRVVLTRPFSQINVGTTGADYKNVLEGSDVFANMEYKYSQISLYGVSKYFDVLDNKVLSDSDLSSYGINDKSATANIVYRWNKFAAFNNGNYPGNDFPADLIGSPKAPGTYEEGEETYDMNPLEEYLYVNLDAEASYKPYMTLWPTVIFKESTETVEGNNGETTKKKIATFNTEIFKYLSMCYVLVAASNSDSNATLSKVVVEFAEELKDGAGVNKNNAISKQEITNVPVKGNWRTNILAGFGNDGSTSTSMFDKTDLLIQYDWNYNGNHEQEGDTNIDD